MQGQYRGNRRVRPRVVSRSGHAEASSARLFICAGCRAQSLICSCCDRGQIYCAGGCGRLARRRSQRAAGARSQTSRHGRRAHAERARRYRARREKVTHHGSPSPSSNDLVPAGSRTIASGVIISDERSRRLASHCHWCGRRCPDLVRQDFMRRRIRRPLGSAVLSLLQCSERGKYPILADYVVDRTRSRAPTAADLCTVVVPDAGPEDGLRRRRAPGPLIERPSRPGSGHLAVPGCPAVGEAPLKPRISRVGFRRVAAPRNPLI